MLDLYCERLGPGLLAEPRNAFSNLAFLLAALVEDGMAARPLKLLLILLALLLIGAGLAHATGSALVRRVAAGERE